MTTTSTGRVFTPGVTADSSQDPGTTTKCTEAVFSLGQMAANMKASTTTTRKRAMACSHGQIADVTKDNGKTVSNTAKDFTTPARVKSRKASGQMAKDCNGKKRNEK